MMSESVQGAAGATYLKIPGDAGSEINHRRAAHAPLRRSAGVRTAFIQGLTLGTVGILAALVIVLLFFLRARMRWSIS